MIKKDAYVHTCKNKELSMLISPGAQDLGEVGKGLRRDRNKPKLFLAVAVEARKLEHPYPHSLQVKYKESQMGCNWDAVLTQ